MSQQASKGYYPIQIPYLLDERFVEQVAYQEEVVEALDDFVICYWQMLPRETAAQELDNIIILDGCIDLIVDFSQQLIGFSGMSQTEYHFPMTLPAAFMGLRLKPGAFCQLTSREAAEAVDAFLPLTTVFADFDQAAFFSLSFAEAKAALCRFMVEKLTGVCPNEYVGLFDRYCLVPPDSVADLCRQLAISPSQCQRVFKRNYGLSPKVVLSILRFQKALGALTTQRDDDAADLALSAYYDQSHLIQDFKRHIGITPGALLARYEG